MNILHIDSSALGANSASRALTAAIVNGLLADGPEAKVTYRDLDADPLPHLTGAVLTGADADAAAAGATVLDEFFAADVVVVGAPMYNFGVPTTLRAWIDRLAIAGKTFRYTASGPEDLAGGRRVIVASTRGGAHGDNPAVDFQETYLRHIFGFIGITDLHFVRAEGLNLSPEHREKAMAAALDTVEQRLAKAA